jgi:hypothetical protein
VACALGRVPGLSLARLIPLTRNEIAHLAAALIIRPARDSGRRGV